MFFAAAACTVNGKFPINCILAFRLYPKGLIGQKCLDWLFSGNPSLKRINAYLIRSSRKFGSTRGEPGKENAFSLLGSSRAPSSLSMSSSSSRPCRHRRRRNTLEDLIIVLARIKVFPQERFYLTPFSAV